MKEFARYVTLSILGQLGISCYIIADTFFISKGLGANEATLEMTTTYLRWILIFAPAFMLNEVLHCFVRNDDAPLAEKEKYLPFCENRNFMDKLQ